MKKNDTITDNLDKHTLIEASAGTGKTYSIERIVEKLLLEPRIINGESTTPLNLSEILIVTFTDKACSELKFRLRNSLLTLYKKERNKDNSYISERVLLLKSLFSKFDENAIYTIHGFCKKNLQEFAFESGFPFSFEVTETSLLISAVLQEIFRGDNDLEQLASLFDAFSDFDKLKKYVQGIMESSLIMRYFFLLNSESIDSFKNRYATIYPDGELIQNSVLDSDKTIYFRNLYNLFHKLAVKLSKYKNSKNLITFDDMIFNLHNELVVKENPVLLDALRNRYKVVIIDEFQDTDRQQWEIFQKIFLNDETGHTIFLVGDPKQSIYRFREADLNVYFEAINKISYKKDLVCNYRSTPILTNALNNLFNYGPLFKHDDMINYENVRSGTDLKVAEFYKGDEKIVPVEFVDLGNNSTISETSEKLGKYIVSYISLITGDNSEYGFLDKEGIKTKVALKDIVVLTKNNQQCLTLQKQLEQYSIPSVIRTKETVFSSEEAKDTLVLLNAIKNPYDVGLIKKSLFTCYFDANLFLIENLDEHDLDAIQKKFMSWNSCFYEDSISGLLSSVIEDNFVREHLLTLKDGRQKISNIIQVFEILNVELNDVSDLDMVVYSLTGLINENNKAYLIRQSKELDAVSIYTMHSSKGLEFKIVFIGDCFYAEKKLINKQKLFFSENGVRKYSLLQDNSIYLDKIARETFDEEKRILYVAMTRAKIHLIMPLVELDKKFSMISLLQKDSESLEDFKNFLRIKDNESLFGITDIFELSFKVDRMKKYSKPLIEGSLKCFLRKNIEKDEFKITSFSEISHTAKSYDQDAELVLRNESGQYDYKDEQDYKHLPKGSNTGNLLHEVLENIDFSAFQNYLTLKNMKETNDDYFMFEDMIIKYLSKYDLSLLFKDAVLEMVFNILNCPIYNDNSSFKLSEIEERKHELEFMIKVKSLSEIKLVFNNDILDESIQFIQDGDYIKGFVDLIFKYNGKFYIADWKSNFLGENICDYNLENIKDSMKHHTYYLQYFIYLDALIKLLEKSVTGFDYNRDFGGIYYFFIRGMNPNNKNQEGIFFHRPTKEEYLKFNKNLQYCM